jgi:hypothetical protein
MGGCMSFSYDMRYLIYIRFIKLQKREIFKTIKRKFTDYLYIQILNIILLFSRSN